MQPVFVLLLKFRFRFFISLGIDCTVALTGVYGPPYTMGVSGVSSPSGLEL